MSDDPRPPFSPHAPRPKARDTAAWADVSGALHPLPAPDFPLDAPFGLDALEAFGAAHALTPDCGLEEAAQHLARHTLIDDAGGRFTIDAESGVIRLAQPSLALFSAGEIHAVRVRSVDAFGGAYESTFHLRITATIPDVVLPDGADPLGLPPLAGHPLALAPAPANALAAWAFLTTPAATWEPAGAKSWRDA